MRAKPSPAALARLEAAALQLLAAVRALREDGEPKKASLPLAPKQVHVTDEEIAKARESLRKVGVAV